MSYLESLKVLFLLTSVHHKQVDGWGCGRSLMEGGREERIYVHLLLSAICQHRYLQLVLNCGELGYELGRLVGL